MGPQVLWSHERLSLLIRHYKALQSIMSSSKISVSTYGNLTQNFGGHPSVGKFQLFLLNPSPKAMYQLMTNFCTVREVMHLL